MGCKPEVTMVWFDEVRTTGGANPSRPYFVEMWDVGGHHEWKNLRAAFYADLDGVVWSTSYEARKYSAMDYSV